MRENLKRVCDEIDQLSMKHEVGVMGLVVSADGSQTSLIINARVSAKRLLDLADYLQQGLYKLAEETAPGALEEHEVKDYSERLKTLTCQDDEATKGTVH